MKTERILRRCCHIFLTLAESVVPWIITLPHSCSQMSYSTMLRCCALYIGPFLLDSRTSPFDSRSRGRNWRQWYSSDCPSCSLNLFLLFNITWKSCYKIPSYTVRKRNWNSVTFFCICDEILESRTRFNIQIKLL
jgi:hypothetical protein